MADRPQLRGDTITFNVGGRSFEILRQTIAAHPSTLLACLLDDVSVDSQRPIFVDANADRFSNILDWYRYGEMFSSPMFPLQALLRDALFFLLPDIVTVDGRQYMLNKSRVPCARDSFDALMAEVAASWEGFETFVDSIATQARQHLLEAAHASKSLKWDMRRFNDSDIAASGSYMVQLATTQLWDPDWVDEHNVCNSLRLQLLAHELASRGFECNVETDLTGVVKLSLSFRRQSSQKMVVQAMRLEGFDHVDRPSQQNSQGGRCREGDIKPIKGKRREPSARVQCVF